MITIIIMGMTITTMATSMSIELSTAQAVMLGHWLSSAYPTGAFAYSHGIEAAMTDGLIVSPDDLEAWIEDILTFGSGRNDAIIFCEAWRRMASDAPLTDLIDLARALTASRPRFLESCQQGSAFLSITLQAWPSSDLARWSAGQEEDLPFPIAFAMAAKAHALPLVPALTAYLSGFAASLVAAALRLSIVGQTKAQVINARFSTLAATRAKAAQQLTLDDLGGSAFHIDIAALRQETVPSRLFRS
jgi:urease accessory protein